MDGICGYLGHQTLVDWCRNTSNITIATVIGGGLLSAFVIARICQCERPNQVPPLQQRVALAQVPRVVHLIAPNERVNTKLVFQKIYRYFISGRDDDQTVSKDNFVQAWKTKFDTFEPHIQERIIKEDMKGWAINKGLKDDDLNTFVEASFSLINERNKSLEFVRDLKTVRDSRTVYYPMNDKEVPTLLLRIIDSL